jgi:hypothetical protein
MRTDKIRIDITNMNKAVEGMMTTNNEEEKNAWAFIYNSRLQSVFTALEEIDKEYEIKTAVEEVKPEEPKTKKK